MADERQMSGWLCRIKAVDFISEPLLLRHIEGVVCALENRPDPGSGAPSPRHGSFMSSNMQHLGERNDHG
ncbi:hypothetical protein, partial [Aeromonas salmonicida]|uniref:hypothetical protein n=1 Tax=Aeromonas salmonicida TaxID=645 RepID=UPI002240BAFD